LDWPANPFWEYSLELYRRPGVEGACLDLQRRHGPDVNLVLLCCWFGTRGIEVERDWLARATAICKRWQREVIRPLREVRAGLKAELATPPASGMAARWPELTAALRQQVLATELDGERLEQLLLADLADDLVDRAPCGVAVATRNLCRYWRFTGEDRPALGIVLKAAFRDVAPADIVAELEGMVP
jgi:uncharacterized protein (TIGR02444 family)